HIGQGGIQLGNSCWELYCLEHGIGKDGIRTEPAHPSKSGFQDDGTSTFVSETQACKLVPRSIHIDLEPTVIASVKTGEYSKLFQPEQLIAAKEAAANPSPCTHSTVGKAQIDV